MLINKRSKERARTICLPPKLYDEFKRSYLIYMGGQSEKSLKFFDVELCEKNIEHFILRGFRFVRGRIYPWTTF